MGLPALLFHGAQLDSGLVSRVGLPTIFGTVAYTIYVILSSYPLLNNSHLFALPVGLRVLAE